MILDMEGNFVMSEEAGPVQKLAPSSENIALDEAMEAMEALGNRPAELKKIKKLFEGTNDTAENYIKTDLKKMMN
ncbi:RuvA C-terminal domain-containing protein, partial [Streptococcus suis]